jgi:hypothetical protein
MKVYLDDERETPPDWALVYWPDGALALLAQGNVAEISVDHDLADDARGTGYDVVHWIEQGMVLHGFVPPAMRVHSANLAAAKRMNDGIAANRRLARRRPSKVVASQLQMSAKHQVGC